MVNNSDTPGAALVLATKQVPTNGHQLWRRAENTLVSLPNNLAISAQAAVPSPKVEEVAIRLDTGVPYAANQQWSFGLTGDNEIVIQSPLYGLNSYGFPYAYLSPAAQVLPEQTPILLRSHDEFRGRVEWPYLWRMNEASPLDCLAAMPVIAASAENAATISEIEAPASPDQLPADALEKFNAALQPEAVTVEDPNVPTEAPPSAEETAQPQRIFLPLVTN